MTGERPDGVTQTPALHSSVTLLVDGKNAFPEIVRCIEHARRSVEINMFIWRDDTVGNRIARAVLTAAENGARVFLSVDRYGVVLEKAEESKRSFFHKRQTLTERIKSRSLELFYPKNGAFGQVADGESELYRRIMEHPNIAVSADEFKADHSKYYIIDGEILFLGGINIEDKENGADLSGRVYGDYMAKLTGKAYVDAFRQKLSTGENASPCTAVEGLFFGANVKDGKTRRFEMEERYLSLIDGAEEELHIVMAYFSPLPRFLSAIVRAYERGVRVTVMIPVDANYQNDSNRKTVRALLKATNGGITVYLTPRMLHTKLVANEKVVSFGSTNITKKAFGQLSELNLFARRDGSSLADALFRDMDENYRAATEVRDYRKVRYRRSYAFFEGFLV